MQRANAYSWTTASAKRFWPSVAKTSKLGAAHHNAPAGRSISTPTISQRVVGTIAVFPHQHLTNINVQRLAVHAALSGDPEHVVHACALDPLTSAVLTLKEIRDMASEMLRAQAEWLPQFEGKSITPKPTISIPRGTKAVHAPPDPAQAILKRFIKLAE